MSDNELWSIPTGFEAVLLDRVAGLGAGGIGNDAAERVGAQLFTVTLQNFIVGIGHFRVSRQPLKADVLGLRLKKETLHEMRGGSFFKHLSHKSPSFQNNRANNYSLHCI